MEENSLVRLVLLKSVNLTIHGPVTGREYHFLGAGSMVDVDALDAEQMLQRVMRSCCTGNTSSYFEVAR